MSKKPESRPNRAELDSNGWLNIAVQCERQGKDKQAALALKKAIELDGKK